MISNWKWRTSCQLKWPGLQSTLRCISMNFRNITSKKSYLLIFASTIWPDSTNNFFYTAKSLHGNELIATNYWPSLKLGFAAVPELLKLSQAGMYMYNEHQRHFQPFFDLYMCTQPHLLHSSYLTDITLLCMLHTTFRDIHTSISLTCSRVQPFHWEPLGIIPCCNLCHPFLDFYLTIYSVSWGNHSAFP